MRHEFRRIGDARQGVLCETSRAVTPFGGMAVLIELFGRMGLLEAVRERLPFTYRSNHSSRPEHSCSHSGWVWWLARDVSRTCRCCVATGRCRSCAG